MIQCKECEFFKRDERGNAAFECDPFGTVKEPECLAKWQLIKTNQLVSGYHAMLAYYRKLAPMQEKMFEVIEREIDDLNDSESWKQGDEAEDDDWPNSP